MKNGAGRQSMHRSSKGILMRNAPWSLFQHPGDYSAMLEGRDVHFVRDVCFASDVRFAREMRNASHHFAVKPQNITVSEANNITCAVRRKHHYSDISHFFERCVPLSRNVMRTSCVMFASQVMCASRVKCGTHHITLRLCRKTSLCRKAQLHLR